MKKSKAQIQLILENKATNQAVVMIPMDLYVGLQELLDDADDLDFRMALKRHADPKRKLISGSELKNALGI
jgi:hypothetical protein